MITVASHHQREIKQCLIYRYLFQVKFAEILSSFSSDTIVLRVYICSFLYANLSSLSNSTQVHLFWASYLHYIVKGIIHGILKNIPFRPLTEFRAKVVLVYGVLNFMD